MSVESAVLLFQWRPEDERDEIAEAMALLKSEYDRGANGRAPGTLPLIAKHTCTSDDPQRFARKLEEQLANLLNLQVLYLSAHGLPDAIARDRTGHVRLEFEELRPFLERGLASARNVTVVFGLCYALSTSSSLTSHLPPTIVKAYGFTETPEARDVAALITGVLAADVTLMQNASSANEAVFGKGVPYTEAGPAFAELERQLDAAVHKYELTHEPEFFVSGKKGCSVRCVRRTGNGSWETESSNAVPGRAGAERCGDGDEDGGNSGDRNE
jgi:hypothetical protein